MSRKKIRPRRYTPDRKTLQLCRQVQRTIELTLSGDFSDDILQSLLVEAVVPAPNAANLLVTVRPFFLSDEISVTDILTKLNFAAPRIRGEVARSITRKRAPNLVFQVQTNAPESEQ